MSKRTSERKPPDDDGYKAYRPAAINEALNRVWNATKRLRFDSGSTWSKAMAPLVQQTARSAGVPPTTLRRRFTQRMENTALGVTVTDQKTTKKRKRSQAHSMFTKAEKKTLYDWIEYRRKHYRPPTRFEFRCQVDQNNNFKLHITRNTQPMRSTYCQHATHKAATT